MMIYSMYDKRGRGDSGPMSICFHQDGTQDTRPKVGGRMRVGSYTARSYQYQDYWTTTEIVKILKRTPTSVVFETKSGSVYTWECLP